MRQLLDTFFDFGFIWSKRGQVLRGFWIDIQIFLEAEFLILIWGLVLAIIRGLPGKAARPARWAAIAYIDLFRGMPSLVIIALIGFGLPIAVPAFQGASVIQLGVIALTLNYGAYVAEVYRAGIESIHWSQSAASRSLGLSQGQTMRFVVLPQAVRRVVPPLLNDFIALQKDAVLVSAIGVNEAFQQAKIAAGAEFNYSTLTGVALCYIVITIPLTRVTDLLIKRDKERLQAGRQ